MRSFFRDFDDDFRRLSSVCRKNSPYKSELSYFSYMLPRQELVENEETEFVRIVCWTKNSIDKDSIFKSSLCLNCAGSWLPRR